MKVKYTDDTPRKIKDFNDEELELNPEQVEDKLRSLKLL